MAFDERDESVYVADCVNGRVLKFSDALKTVVTGQEERLAAWDSDQNASRHDIETVRRSRLEQTRRVQCASTVVAISIIINI